MGAIIDALHMNNEEVRLLMRNEVEAADFTLLPGNNYLKPSTGSHFTGISVQPDAWIDYDSVYTLLEAKRIKGGAFQSEQLAREFVLVTRESKDKYPLLFLVLGKEPPIRVQKLGRISIEDAILEYIDEVYEKTENHHLDIITVKNMISTNVAWITWSEIRLIIEKQIDTFSASSESTYKCINRLSEALINAIDIHE